MIKVNVTTNDNLVDKISISGHAMYDDYGKDIVCASVSTMVITTVNAISRLRQNDITCNQDDGFVEIVINTHNSITDTLIENLIDLLKELEQQYNKNLKTNRLITKLICFFFDIKFTFDIILLERSEKI